MKNQILFGVLSSTQLSLIMTQVIDSFFVPGDPGLFHVVPFPQNVADVVRFGFWLPFSFAGASAAFFSQGFTTNGGRFSADVFDRVYFRRCIRRFSSSTCCLHLVPFVCTAVAGSLAGFPVQTFDSKPVTAPIFYSYLRSIA